MSEILETNAGRDRLEVHNRLDQVVLAVSPHGQRPTHIQMTPDTARQLAALLLDAAQTGEHTAAS